MAPEKTEVGNVILQALPASFASSCLSSRWPGLFSAFCIHVCLWILDYLEGILKENSIKFYMTSCNLTQRSSHVGLQFSVGNSLPLSKCREVWVQVWGAVMGMGIIRQEKRLHTSPPSSFIRSHLIWAQISCFLGFAIASNQGWLWKKSQHKCLRFSKCIEFEILSQWNVIFCLVSVFDVSPCSQLTALSHVLAVFWGVGSLCTLQCVSLVWSRRHGCQACEMEKRDVKSGKAPFCAAREESTRCSGFLPSFKGKT